MASEQRSPALPHGVIAASAVTLGMVATVGGALAFEHIGGYIPCALCLLQRDPYYYGIPVGIAAILASMFRLPAWVSRSLLVLVGIMMLVGAGMGVYHAGVEWGFWEGPATCATSSPGITTNAGSLLDDLNAFHGPSCTQASLRVLGLSFAGWNVIASIILAALAFLGATRKAA
ncbi:disulfide bond formation protein B [Pseudorhizobium endolithicum]|uniref:Disulfide bond formation protein B n=1 Tax=Pseudorhizobium endolithicum TaxID=1191678 RepID=A0ABM8PKC3_9HYPH|nr:disulfide bond formation protein B [Pseudorhizobium endolithicum]CAD6432691.1 disulfide bond formation protein B [Rhizobium sp. Q54]CAD7034663.1 disulfide bond formation protein B [Pseudorhizobium endolithicum]